MEVNRPTDLTATRPITQESMTSSQELRSWANQVTLSIPITGNGSPEGIVEGVSNPFPQLYIDLDGTTGTIEYRKMQDDIAGDKTMGWVLV